MKYLAAFIVVMTLAIKHAWPVDDILVINRCVPELRAGPIGLAARAGPAVFKDIRCYPSNPSPKPL